MVIRRDPVPTRSSTGVPVPIEESLRPFTAKLVVADENFLIMTGDYISEAKPDIPAHESWVEENRFLCDLRAIAIVHISLDTVS